MNTEPTTFEHIIEIIKHNEPEWVAQYIDRLELTRVISPEQAYQLRYSYLPTKQYTLTISAHPLKGRFEEELNIFNQGVTRVVLDSMDNAVALFVKQCSRLDSGCVQLWENDRVIGQLYI